MRKLSNDSLEKIKTDSYKILEVLNNLVTVISDKSMLTVNQNELLNYKIQFIEECTKLENNISTLKKNKYICEDLMKKYDDLNARINNDEFKSLVEPKEVQKELLDQNEQELIDELLKELDNDNITKDDIKIINKTKKTSFLEHTIVFLIKIVLNIAIIIGLSGFLKWGEWQTPFYLIYYILYVSLIDGIFSLLFKTLLKKWIFKTFGLILIVPSILSLIISLVFPIFVTIKSYGLLLIIFIVTVIIQKFILAYILSKMGNRLFSKKERIKK